MHENCLTLDRVSKITKGMVGNKGALEEPAVLIVQSTVLQSCSKTTN